MRVPVLYGQTVIDLAVQQMGDPERAFEIALLNDVSITDDLVSHFELETPEADKTKKSLVQLFSDQANAPASADTDSLSNKPEGIDYWILENDFVVQ